MGIGRCIPPSNAGPWPEPLPRIGVRLVIMQCRAHDDDHRTAPRQCRAPMKMFFRDGISADSWTPGPKPLCHRHPTGPRPSGLWWTPAKDASMERAFALVGETDEGRGFGDGLSFGHDGIGREAVVRPAQRNALHDDLIVRDAGVLAHHGGLHDALA